MVICANQKCSAVYFYSFLLYHVNMRETVYILYYTVLSAYKILDFFPLVLQVPNSNTSQAFIFSFNHVIKYNLQ